MKVYVRKVYRHDITHEVNITKEVFVSFFEENRNITILGRSSNFKAEVNVNSATDLRVGGDFKTLLVKEGGIDVDDIIIIEKNRNKYVLYIVKLKSNEFDLFSKFFMPSDRHTLLFTDDASGNLNNDVSVSNTSIVGHNRIYYGIPGSGKSYYINNVVLKDVDKEKDVFRVTFYQDYSNSDFFGQVFPVVNKGNITYEPIPGPFTKAIERALLNKDKMIYLVIEELNRGNAAAIFGDAFQLLDRLKENRDGMLAGSSEYPISCPFIEGYFNHKNEVYTKNNQPLIDFKPNQIVIPSNLTILATMNTSDQNVYPLDTAFKRRWDRERIVESWDNHPYAEKYIPSTDITWKEFAQKVNTRLISGVDETITEDKKMGPYFASSSMFVDQPFENDDLKIIKFANNVLDYLFNDVTKFDHSILFCNDIKSLDDISIRLQETNEANAFIKLFTKQLQFDGYNSTEDPGNITFGN